MSSTEGWASGSVITRGVGAFSKEELTGLANGLDVGLGDEEHF